MTGPEMAQLVDAIEDLWLNITAIEVVLPLQPETIELCETLTDARDERYAP